MKRCCPPLIALALVAGACSSNIAPEPPRPIAAVPAGTLQTAWGEVPSYRAEDNRFPFAIDWKRPVKLPPEYRSGDSAVLDVLVARNGAVRDVKVHRSSGVDAVDRFFMNRFVGARSLLEAANALPYVVRVTFALRNASPIGDGQLGGPSDVRPMGTGAKHPMDR